MSPSSTRMAAPSLPVPERMKRARAAAHREGAARPPPSIGEGTAVALARATSGVPDAWVEDRVHEVHHETDEYDEERYDDDRRLHDRVVPGGDGVQDVAADADPAEDRLGEDGAAEQGAELQADDGHDRYERVAEGVPEHDHPIPQALRARGHEVIAAQDLEHARPSHARDDGHGDRAERERGKDEVPEHVTESGQV